MFILKEILSEKQLMYIGKVKIVDPEISYTLLRLISLSPFLFRKDLI